MKVPLILYALKCVLMALFLVSTPSLGQAELSPIERLGQFLYFDKTLSEPDGQACASCHEPRSGFADPDRNLPVSEGVKSGLFGERNSPISAYAMYAPALHHDKAEDVWVGGQFWDGRAKGNTLGDPLADQALGPFVNPVEMANPDKSTVIRDVKKSEYAALFEQVWGQGSLDDIDKAYDRVALSIAAFERTGLFAQFSSKYDAYLEACLSSGGDKNDCAKGKGKISAYVGRAYFSRLEWRGFNLFIGENNNNGLLEEGEGAMCAACHVVEWTQATDNVAVPGWAPNGRVPPLFTDFTYDNLGVPKSTHILLASNSIDRGLGTVVNAEHENGKFKVMTVRNIELSAPYAHNGFFNTLDELVHFYNTRDVAGSVNGSADWPKPEVPETLNRDELGNLGLSDDDERALSAFMKTLTDGYER